MPSSGSGCRDGDRGPVQRIILFLGFPGYHQQCEQSRGRRQSRRYGASDSGSIMLMQRLPVEDLLLDNKVRAPLSLRPNAPSVKLALAFSVLGLRFDSELNRWHLSANMVLTQALVKAA